MGRRGDFSARPVKADETRTNYFKGFAMHCYDNEVSTNGDFPRLSRLSRFELPDLG